MDGRPQRVDVKVFELLELTDIVEQECMLLSNDITGGSVEADNSVMELFMFGSEEPDNEERICFQLLFPIWEDTFMCLLIDGECSKPPLKR